MNPAQSQGNQDPGGARPSAGWPSRCPACAAKPQLLTWGKSLRLPGSVGFLPASHLSKGTEVMQENGNKSSQGSTYFEELRSAGVGATSGPRPPSAEAAHTSHSSGPSVSVHRRLVMPAFPVQVFLTYLKSEFLNSETDLLRILGTAHSEHIQQLLFFQVPQIILKTRRLKSYFQEI